MNRYQQVWWEQTRADHVILQLLRREGAAPCHQLHYLQMVTEKLGKAYFWRTGRPPRTTHASLVRFLQALNDRASPDADRIARLLGFGRSQDLQNWIPLKPSRFVAGGSKGPAQPAVKCRGRKYLRIIYRPEYTFPAKMLAERAVQDGHSS